MYARIKSRGITWMLVSGLGGERSQGWGQGSGLERPPLPLVCMFE